MFRKLKSVPLSYKRQGYIYFTCQNYLRLDATLQQQIAQLCMKITSEYYQPLFKLLTADPDEFPAWKIADNYYINTNILYKLRKRFFLEFENLLKNSNLFICKKSDL